MTELDKHKIETELNKCKNDPHYFATTYLVLKNHKDEIIPFTTLYTKEEFNQIIKNYERKIS